MRRSWKALALALGLGLVGVDIAAAQTLKAVRDRGTLNCGVDTGAPGFAAIP